MRRIGDILSAILDEDTMKKARGYSALFSCWQDLTEKNGIAAAVDHSWIKSLDRGLVWIEVDHPGWKQMLQTKESKLLSDFRRRFPEMDISGLSIMLCRPGTRPEFSEEDSSVESAPPEKIDPAAGDENRGFPPEPIPAAEGFDAIKEGSLKDALLRLEQSIAGRG